jgi:transposase InsO family protein
VRGAGFEYVHVAIDDHSRIATATVQPNEQAGSAVAALQTTLAWYARLGIRFKTVLTDNGPCYRSRQFAQACRRAGIQHRRTRPYTPRTNGKAERFIQTALREWAYACSYHSSEQRNILLPRWLHAYNWHRPHASLNLQPPISRAALDRNNLLRHHTYGMTDEKSNDNGNNGKRFTFPTHRHETAMNGAPDLCGWLRKTKATTTATTRKDLHFPLIAMRPR